MKENHECHYFSVSSGFVLVQWFSRVRLQDASLSCVYKVLILILFFMLIFHQLTLQMKVVTVLIKCVENMKKYVFGNIRE